MSSPAVKLVTSAIAFYNKANVSRTSNYHANYLVGVVRLIVFFRVS